MAETVADNDNPMLLHGKNDRGGVLYPRMTYRQAKRWAMSMVQNKGGPSWKDFMPSVPQAKGIAAAVPAAVEAVKDVKDDIKYQFKPLTIDDEAARFKGQPNDNYYHNILVGGANAGGNGFWAQSELPFGVLATGDNKKLFRNGDIKGIRSEIDRAVKERLHPRVVGHSWGGADIARMAKDYPDIPFIALDPVSWTGRIDELPKNLSIMRPRNTSYFGNEHENLFGYLAGKLGGRWPKIDKGEGTTYYYNGGHATNANHALNWLAYKQWADRVSQEGVYRPRETGIPYDKWMKSVYRKVYPENKK